VFCFDKSFGESKSKKELLHETERHGRRGDSRVPLKNGVMIRFQYMILRRRCSAASMRRFLLAGYALATVFLGARGLSDVLLTDDFSYPDGPLQEVTRGIWTGHSGTENQVDALAGRVELTSSESQDVNSLLAGQPYDTANASAIFTKFIVRFSSLPSVTGSYFAHFNTTGFRARVWAQASEAVPDTFRFGISSVAANAPTSVFPADLFLNTDYVVVTRLNLVDGLTTLWVNPASENDLAVFSDAGPPVIVSSYAFRQSPGMGEMSVDELVVATRFEEAIQNVSDIQRAPAITAQPESQTAVEGDTVVFSVAATGNPLPSYRWQHNGVDLIGETAAALTLVGVTEAQEGMYQVFVSNVLDSVSSDLANLTVNPPPVTIPSAPVISFTNFLTDLVRPGDLPVSTDFTEYALRTGETLTINAVIIDTQGLPVVVRPVGEALPARAAWDITQVTAGRVEATLILTAEADDAGRNYFAQLEAVNAQGTNRAPWRVYVPTATEQKMVINEFLANPSNDPLAPHYNPLNRETPSSESRTSTEDEYVEIVNLSGQTIDLAGWSVSDAVGVRLTFGTFDFLTTSNAVVAYGGRNSGSSARLSEGVLAVPATRVSGLALNNNGDTIVIRNSRRHLIARVVYPGSSVRGDGSLTRAPDLTGDFFPHSTVAFVPVSPGTLSDGIPFGPPNASPVPLKASATPGTGFAINIRWNAETNRTYSVWRAEVAGGPYVPVLTNIFITNATQSSYLDNDAPNLPHRFYRIRSP